jgi:hypothetical protein
VAWPDPLKGEVYGRGNEQKETKKDEEQLLDRVPNEYHA